MNHLNKIFVIFFLGLFLSCGEDPSTKPVEELSNPSLNSYDNEIKSSSSVNRLTSSSSAAKESMSSAKVKVSSSSEKSTESSSGKNAEPTEESSCGVAEGSSSSTTVEQSSSSVKTEQSSSSEKANASSSSEKVQESSSSAKVEESSSSAKTEPSSSSEKPAESSSSEKVVESSSSEASSSSAIQPCKTATEDNCIYGTLLDKRDGYTYKTVKIGDQEWMAENLAYECDSLKPWNRSVCHQDPDTCAKYGRLYFWGAAMDSLKTGCGYGTRCSPQFPVHGICPEGWHIPSREEIVILLKNVGDASGLNLRTTNSWTKPRKCNGNDGYGFSALPAGYYIGGDSSPFARINTEADILLSDEYDKNRILILQIIGPASVSGCNRIAEIYQLWNKSDAASVRCIKD